ncbi:MAG TPA: EAL domain-containing protein [Candidatus Competibacteraceae bacterium]|nr:EAL domain-containing protein [Candidatus Competibacteraceae bacterium]
MVEAHKDNQRTDAGESGTAVGEGQAVGGIFSLKWKAVLAVVAALAALIAGQVLYSHSHQQQTFAEQHRLSLARSQRELQERVQNELDRLQQLAQQLPNQPGLREFLPSADAARLQELLELLGGDLGQRWRVSALALYDRGNRLLAAWEGDGAEHSRAQQVLNWTRQVSGSGTPVQALHCAATCWLYTVVPMHQDRRQVGAVLAVAPLAPVLQALQRVSGGEAGVLLPLEAGPGPGTVLADWGQRLLGIGEGSRLQQLLQSAASRQRLPEGAARLSLDWNQRRYELVLLPLPSATGAPRLVLAQSVTDLAGGSGLGIVLLGGVLAWVLAGGVLLTVLWGPLGRLGAITRSLPLLAQRQFGRAWEELARQCRASGGDEVDRLGRGLMAVSKALDRAEAENAEQCRAANERLAELGREHGFLSGILTAAQVAVLTQDGQGRILTANPTAQNLTGYKETELRGRDFFETLFAEGAAGLRWRLKEELALRKHRLDHLSHESLTIRKDGTIRSISWYHSRLPGKPGEDPLILSIGVDSTERRSNESRLAWMTEHDALTGLPNRRRFVEELEHRLRAAANAPAALLLLRLDQYQQLMESGGYHSADLALKVVARLLASDKVPAELRARLGGEEFALVLTGDNADLGPQLAESLNRALRRTPVTAGEHSAALSVSIGIACFPEHGRTPSDLLGNADLALHKAREQGGGCYHIYSEADKTWERVRQRAYWKDKVSQALTNDRFVLYFQPIIELRTGNIAYFEVLLRMLDERGGVISAARFIEAAERGGMIHAVDRLVVSKAFEALAVVNLRGLEVGFSINLSGHAFNDPQLLPHIRRELERHPVATRNIVFEINETAAVSDFAVASSLMLGVKELGCRFALDNFGIGFSSFYYLKHLPVDFLKINGAFVRDLARNMDDQTLVRAIAQTAAGFGKQTIAEAVETEPALDLLREFGVDYAQGYYIGKPLRAEAAFRKIERERALAAAR